MKLLLKPFAAIFMLVGSTILFAGTTGNIAYLEGTVDVSRNGEFLSYYDVDYGLQIEEEDIISTGPDGYVEIELNAPAAGTVLKVEGNTSFYFSTNAGQTDMKLLSGTLALKVGLLTQGENLNVHTESAVMGVRGTEFTVNVAADSELLITCKEGKVACSSSARETFAEPGTVSTWSQTGDLTEDNVNPSDLDEYTQHWQQARIDALMINGLRATEYYRRQLETYQARMTNAMDTLLANERMLQNYSTKMNQGVTLSRTEAARDKIALSRGILEVRSNLVMYEQIFFTLSQLQYYHNQGVGAGRFSDGSSSESFYREFERNKRANMTMIAKAHYYMRVYTYIDHYASANDVMGGGNSGLDSFLNNSPLQ
ncbi:MAG: FecR family protein [Spirochaetaceae bacterium]|jgi:hypothetical protein|nr:FecR family protein [Spirochaetaceae bacterium]